MIGGNTYDHNDVVTMGIHLCYQLKFIGAAFSLQFDHMCNASMRKRHRCKLLNGMEFVGKHQHAVMFNEQHKRVLILWMFVYCDTISYCKRLIVACIKLHIFCLNFACIGSV